MFLVLLGRLSQSNTPTPWKAFLASRRSFKMTASIWRTTWSRWGTSSARDCPPRLTRRPPWLTPSPYSESWRRRGKYQLCLGSFVANKTRRRRTDAVSSPHDLDLGEDLYGVVQVTGWEPSDLHDVSHVCWLGYVLNTCCTTCHNDR